MDLINYAVNCGDIAPIIKFIKSIFNIIQWFIPIALIIMGSIDLGKAVLSSDDKEIKQATSKLIKRAIAAVAIFFIVLIVELVMNLVSDANGDNNMLNCWKDPNKSDNLYGSKEDEKPKQE